MRTPVLPYLFVLASIVSIQVGSSVGKGLFGLIGVEAATLLRQGFAAILLLALLRPWRHWPKGAALRWLLLYGVLLGVMNLTFYMAIARIPIGVGVALEFTGPLAVAVLGSRRPVDFLWVALAVVGLGLLVPWGEASGGLDPIGVGFALFAGACWGLYIVVGQRVSDRMDGAAAATFGLGIAALLTLPLGLLHFTPAVLSPEALMRGLFVAVLAAALPYTLEMIALKSIPARTFGLMMSLEPAVAALAAFVILGESLSWAQVAAIFCVAGATAGSSLTSKRSETIRPQ